MRNMPIDSKAYHVPSGKKLSLSEWPTAVPALTKSKKNYQKLLEEHVGDLSALQQLHYASNRHALLLIFQGMDAAGKDGAIRHVMSGINRRMRVSSFKQPSAEELEHDSSGAPRAVCRARPHRHLQPFLLRRSTRRPRPSGGASYEGLSKQLEDDKSKWDDRYRSIVDFEKHLDRNNTRVVKVFLHISKEEQRKRFLARIDDPDKNWKLSLADIQERKFWKEYMKAYEECLSATSTHHAPWYVVPADNKDDARLIVSQIVLDALRELKSSYPATTQKHRADLKSIRKMLAK